MASGKLHLIGMGLLVLSLAACNDRRPVVETDPPDTGNPDETPIPPPTGPVCGNGTCETGETESSCAADCGTIVVPPPVAVCGNGACETGESQASCPADCGALGPVCGNGTCEVGETTASCAADCPAPPPPAPAPEIVSFTVSDSCVEPGNSQVTLSWSTRNATAVTLDSAAVAAAGSQNAAPAAAKTYVLTASNGTRSVTRRVRVNFKTPTTVMESAAHALEPAPLEQLKAATDGTIIFLADGRPYKGGLNSGFTEIDPNAAVSEWAAVGIEPGNSSVLYAAATGRIYRSEDGGATWPGVIPIRRNNANLEPYAVYPSAANANEVFIGFAGGAFKLDVGARSLNLMVPLNTRHIRHFAAQGSEVLAATVDGIYMSTDNGGAWIAMSVPAWGTIHSLTFTGGAFYAATDTGLYALASDSLAWSPEANVPGPVFDVLAGAEGVYAATGQGTYFKGSAGWIAFHPESAYWLLPGSGYPVSVSEDQWYSFSDRTEYSSSSCSAMQVDPALVGVRITNFDRNVRPRVNLQPSGGLTTVTFE